MRASSSIVLNMGLSSDDGSLSLRGLSGVHRPGCVAFLKASSRVPKASVTLSLWLRQSCCRVFCFFAARVQDLEVVNNSGNVKRIRPQEIRGKRNTQSRRAFVVDSQNNQLEVRMYVPMGWLLLIWDWIKLSESLSRNASKGVPFPTLSRDVFYFFFFCCVPLFLVRCNGGGWGKCVIGDIFGSPSAMGNRCVLVSR